MADSIVTTVLSRLVSTRTPEQGIYAGKHLPWADQWVLRLAAGTAKDQADLRFARLLTFAASTAQTINLSNCTGEDGVTCNFARVRLLAIRVRATNDAASLTIDNAGATNPFTGFVSAAGQLVLRPSTATSLDALAGHGFVILTAPGTTAAAVGTGVNLRLLPSAHAFQAEIVVIGSSV